MQKSKCKKNQGAKSCNMQNYATHEIIKGSQLHPKRGHAPAGGLPPPASIFQNRRPDRRPRSVQVSGLTLAPGMRNSGCPSRQ